MNLVNANVAAEWRFGSLYLEGLLQTATIKGCKTASRVSEPKAHLTQTTTCLKAATQLAECLNLKHI